MLLTVQENYPKEGQKEGNDLSSDVPKQQKIHISKKFQETKKQSRNIFRHA